MGYSHMVAEVHMDCMDTAGYIDTVADKVAGMAAGRVADKCSDTARMGLHKVGRMAERMVDYIAEVTFVEVGAYSS